MRYYLRLYYRIKNDCYCLSSQAICVKISQCCTIHIDFEGKNDFRMLKLFLYLARKDCENRIIRYKTEFENIKILATKIWLPALIFVMSIQKPL